MLLERSRPSSSIPCGCRLALVLCLVVGWPCGAAAQEGATRVAPADAPAPAPHRPAGGEPDRHGAGVVHPTAGLLLDAAARGAARLPRQAAAKAAGTEPARTDTFFVRDLLSAEPSWYTVAAERAAVGDPAVLWIGRAEADTLRRRGLYDAVVGTLSTYLFDATPAPSVDPGLGVIDLVARTFGDPTDVDGSGRVDVLLLDIPDHFASTGAFIAGFFDPVNLTDHPASNRRDLVYVDLAPTVLYDGRVAPERGAATVAHELQHLTLEAYPGADEEATFVNEGLSELSEIVCGFAPRPPAAFVRDPGRPLLSWTAGDALPDYARASLFTHYLFEQAGYEHLPAFVRDPAAGREAIERLLARAGLPPLEALHARWALALLVGDADSDGTLGYRHPARRGYRLAPSARYDALPALVDAALPPLGLAFLDFPLTRELRLAPDGAGRLDPAAVAYYPDGRQAVLPRAGPGGTLRAGDGAGGGLRLALQGSDAPAPARMLATGTPSGHEVTLAFDDNIPDAFAGQARFFLLRPGQAVALPVAFRRHAAEGTLWLHGVSVQGLFLSEVQGSGVPPSAETDFDVEVRVYEGGRPGRLLLPPQRVVVRRPGGQVQFEHAAFDLARQDFGALPDSVALVIRDDGDDENAFAVAMDGRAEAAGVFDPGAERWQPLSAVQVQGAWLRGFSPMIRASLVVPEADRPPVAALAVSAAADSAAEAVVVTVSAGEPLDLRASRCVARLPSGRHVAAGAAPGGAGAFSLRFTIPLETGGAYAFTLGVRGAGGSRVEVVWPWHPPALPNLTVSAPFPNPSNGVLYLPLRLREAAPVSLTLYDVLGRQVARPGVYPLAAGAHTLPLAAGDLPAGIYFVAVDAGGERQMRRIVLLHGRSPAP